MGENYRPKHHEARAGQDPEPQQTADYLMADGDITTCIMHQVDISADPVAGTPSRSPDGNYINVSATILYPARSRFSPGRADRDGHVYKRSTGQVLSSECGPPWPPA